MALYRIEAAEAWSDPITIADDSIVQVQAGSVYMALDAMTAPADLSDGLLMSYEPMRPSRDSIDLSAGTVVRFRAATSRSALIYIGIWE